MIENYRVNVPIHCQTEGKQTPITAYESTTPLRGW